MRGKAINYFENSRRAIYAQQAYAMRNPKKFAGYDRFRWGITASDGPGPAERASTAGACVSSITKRDRFPMVLTMARWRRGLWRRHCRLRPEVVLPSLRRSQQRLSRR